MPRAGARIINPGLYDHLRASGHYPQTGVIRSPSSTTSLSGAEITDPQPKYVDVPCRLASPGGPGGRGGGELERKDGTIVKADLVAELPGTYLVDETDEFAVDGVTYEIVLVEHASSDGRTRLTLLRRE